MNIDKKLIDSLMKSVAGRYAVYVVQLVSMVIMARIFTPENFGVFAIIHVFSAFFILFSEMGLGPALIDQKTVSRRMRDGVFSVTWIIGFVLATLFVLSGPVISSFYSNDLYHTLVIPLAISIVFSTAAIVPLASLQKESRFILIARCDGLAEIFSLIGVLILVMNIEPIVALSIKPLIAAIFRLLFLWRASKETSTGQAIFGRYLGEIKQLLSFSLYQFGFNIVNYFSRNLDNILVGKYFSTASLGAYDKAYQLMRYPLMLLTFAMNPAIQPVLTELKDNPIEFERLHNKFVRYMSLLGLIIGISVCFLAEWIVIILLGSQWLNVIPLLEILSLTIPIQIVLSSSGGFFQAAGRVDLLFKCGVFSSIVNVIAIIIGVSGGTLEGLCWCLLASFSINFTQCYYVLSKYLLPSGFVLFFKQIWISVAGTMLFTAWVFNH